MLDECGTQSQHHLDDKALGGRWRGGGASELTSRDSRNIIKATKTPTTHCKRHASKVSK